MAEGDQVATDPVDLTGGEAPPAPEPEPFDWKAEIPLDKFPEAMRESLKGKTFEGFAADHTKMRQIASKLGVRNKELESELEKQSGKKAAEDLSDAELDELLKDRLDKQIIQQPDYQQVVEGFIETGEVSEEFLDAVETGGVKVSREDALDYLEWFRDRRQQLIENLSVAAEGVEGQDLWDWIGSEECTLDPEMIKGFNQQARRENDYSWVPLAVKKYNEWLEGGGKQPARGRPGRFAGPTRRGRPPQPKAGEGEISKDDFASEYMKLSRQQARGEISKADEIKAKRVLEQRRRATAD